MVLKCTVREPEPPAHPDETLVYETCRLCGDRMATHHGDYWYKGKPHSLLDNDVCSECEDQVEVP